MLLEQRIVLAFGICLHVPDWPGAIGHCVIEATPSSEDVLLDFNVSFCADLKDRRGAASWCSLLSYTVEMYTRSIGYQIVTDVKD